MSKEKSIVLIGFMGVGKSTIGRELAKKYKRKFIDIDLEIEKIYGMKTTEIFNKYGENAFREKEKELSGYYARQPGFIVSLGGEAFMNEEIRSICVSCSLIIYLDLSWEYWKYRISILVDSRPILQKKSMKEIKALFHLRKKIYHKHHIKINMDDLNIEDAVTAVIEALERFNAKNRVDK
ncbi:shikimate kinase [Virgibacillus sp. YIM 98842]|uniref:shikimate kinase n=1 Tax=Virgibacillus sp. YIM 98842 TaxID=2663533 RepID=UPI0013D94640|nr:shikimate kinase [Virgibacillus sp. YIM 98842]